MNIEKPIAVIGTNSWGSALYEKAIRGEAVSDYVIRHPKEFAALLRQMIEGEKLPLETGEYTGEELTALISEREDWKCIR